MKIRSIISMAMSAAVLISCSDWTDPESIKIEVASLEKDNPEVYAEYCQSIRDYKAGDHKIVYVSFDNQQKKDNQSYNLTSLPDSIDVVELSNPELIDQALVDQMNKLRTEKSFQFAVEFSFDKVLDTFNKTIEEMQEAYEAERDTVAAHGGDPDSVKEPDYPDGIGFLEDELDRVFKFVDDYDLEVVRVQYANLMNRKQLTAEEDSSYVAEQTTIFEHILKRFKSHSGTKMYLNAKAEFIVSEDIINAAEYVILPTESLSGTEDMDYMGLRTNEVYPSAKLLYSVYTTITDNYTMGYFTAGEQLPLASKWLSVPVDNYSKAGLVIYNARNTFFDTNRNVYSKLRNAIRNLNPNS